MLTIILSLSLSADPSADARAALALALAAQPVAEVRCPCKCGCAKRDGRECDCGINAPCKCKGLGCQCYKGQSCTCDAYAKKDQKSPPADIYGEAYRKAIRENKRLYIGVRRDPPTGDGVCVRVESFDGVAPGHSAVIIGHPTGQGTFFRQDFPVWATQYRGIPATTPVVTEFVVPGAYSFQPRGIVGSCGPSG